MIRSDDIRDAISTSSVGGMCAGATDLSVVNAP
jgi:hypothetical protein